MHVKAAKKYSYMKIFRWNKAATALLPTTNPRPKGQYILIDMSSSTAAPPDDNKFSALRLVESLQRAARSDGKVDLDAYRGCYYEYERFIKQEYGMVGSVIVSFIRKDATLFVDFLDEKKISGSDRNAATLLDLCDPEAIKNRDFSCPGFQIAVHVAFISCILRVYAERFKPEVPGSNFLLEAYEATWGKFHPWVIQKASSFLLGFHRGKTYWMEHYCQNETLYPGDTLDRLLEAYTRIRDDFATLLRERGYNDLISL